MFVHPRDPYTRVDALRSNRRVRVELDGVVLADSASPVMVFETGLPTRYYVNRTDVRFEHLVPSGTVTSCPYKGMTSGYWSVRAGGTVHKDLAWAYDFPTRQLLPIAGLVAFYNEKVDTFLDGEPLDRPQTHFSRTGRDGSSAAAARRRHQQRPLVRCGLPLPRLPGEFTGRLWISAGHALPFYPNAITLSPDVTAAEATAGQDPSRPFAIKDSFARLDLAPHGLTPLFDAGGSPSPLPAGR